MPFKLEVVPKGIGPTTICVDVSDKTVAFWDTGTYQIFVQSKKQVAVLLMAIARNPGHRPGGVPPIVVFSKQSAGVPDGESD